MNEEFKKNDIVLYEGTSYSFLGVILEDSLGEADFGKIRLWYWNRGGGLGKEGIGSKNRMTVIGSMLDFGIDWVKECR